MATISTTTIATTLDWPGHSTAARDPISGFLYVFGRVDASNTYRVWRSVDGGASWAAYASFTRTGLVEWSSVVIDKAKRLHIAYRYSDGSFDRLFYRQLNLLTATWSAEVQASNTGTNGDPNGGVAGGWWQGVDLAVVQNSNRSYSIAVVGCYTNGTTGYGIWVHGVTIDTSGNIYKNNAIISNNRNYQIAGTAPGRSSPVCEIEHNGDGFTSLTPHLWITFGRTKLYVVKLSWQGSTGGWQGPSSSSIQTIDSSIPAADYVPIRWDGNRMTMAAINSADSSVLDVYQRNQANTSTTVLNTPQHTNGAIRAWLVTYDWGTKNIRIYAVGTTNATVYRVEYVRATATWGTWTQMSADAVTGSPPTQFTSRRGGTSGNGKYDVVYLTGTVTPWTLKNVQEATQYTPGTPTWDTSAGVYANGSAVDVNAALLLDWTFVDTDPSDSQASYALRRQIGAGSFAWWRASDSTWQASETFNTGTTTALTLASGWGAGTDANHSYAVKTRDTGGLDSPYSAAMVLVPSVKVNPSITSPTAAQVLGTNYVTLTWTAAEQKQYRITMATNPGGQTVYDSGLVTDSTTTSVTLPTELADSTGWTVSLTTTNLEGLASTTQTRNFTVDYTEPAAATLVVTPMASLGAIRVAVTNPTPSGSQPALSTQDLYRRHAESVTLNANPNFTGNATGWTGSSGTMTYSTAQAHEGAGSARFVPNGVAINTFIESDLVVIDPATTYFAGGWARPDTANKPVQIQLNWWTTGGAYISSEVRLVTPPIAGVWQYLTVTGAPVATAGKASVSMGISATPAATDALYIDELVLQAYRSTTGTRVATGLGSGPTFDDKRARARQPYEYRTISYGTNGTQIASPWTA